MARTKIDYGIDLGTTNSAIARMESGNPIIKKSDTQMDTMPSCVHFNKKKSISVGQRAFNSNKNDKLTQLKSFNDAESNAFIEFKRTMGTDKKFISSNMGQEYTSEELSSEILKTLKSFITDEDVNSVVITVPAMFNTTQVDATQKAAELAGFNYIELLQEPIAASMAYGLDENKTDGFWLVFDFGGGTFDAALVRVEDGIMKVIDTEGDNHLGGKDVDYAVVDSIILPYLQSEYSIKSIISDQNKKNILRDAMKFFAEQAKIQLSFSESYDLLTDLGEIPGTDDEGQEFELDFTITREDFKNAVFPVFQQAIDICKNLVSRNNLVDSDLSTLLLVGGPTYSPILREMLLEQVSKNINISIDPMTAVSVGAALYASTRDIPNKHQNRDATKIQLDLKYEATSVETEEYVTIKILRDNTVGDIPEQLFIELVRSDQGWSSGKVKIEGDADLIEVNLEANRANGFEVLIYDEKGSPYPCEPSEITILQGSKIGNATLPKNLGIEVKDSVTGRIGFRTITGLEKNGSIPAIGKGTYKTQKELRPGNVNDIIKIPIYEGEIEADGTKAIHNELVKEIIITGEDVPKFLPAGSEVEITLKIDSSRRIDFKAFFPHLEDSKELEIERTITSVVSSEKLDTEIEKAKNQIHILSEDNAAVDYLTIQALESELSEVQESLNNGRNDDDNRNKVLNKLRKTLKKIDAEEQMAEWPNVEEELSDSIEMLETNNERYGTDKTTEIVNQMKTGVDVVISKKDVKLGRELVEQIRSFSFALVDEGAGVAVDISILKGLDDDFEIHDWSDRSKARTLLNQAKQIVSTNPTKAQLRPIVIELYSLLPDVEKKGMMDDDGTVLIN